MSAPAGSSGVGLIVPVRLPAPYLAEALDSALGQDPPPDAVVVVDNASQKPLRLRGRHASSCRVVRRETDGGPAAARASGLATLAAPLVALLDSDDIWEPGRLRSQLEVMERRPDIAVCFGRALIVGPDGRPTGDRLEEAPGGAIEAEAMARLLFERNPVPTSSALIRREALEASGGFDVPATDDWGCWMRLAESGANFYYDPGVTIRYRRHPGGLTSDLTKVARIGLAVQAAHGRSIDPDTRARVRRDYLTLLARGHIRSREWAQAREALREARRAAPLGRRERALGIATAVPGLRSALGRREPWGGR